MDGTHRPNQWFCLGIVNMPTIPSNKVVNVVHGGNGHVRSVVDGYGRQSSVGYQDIDKICRRFSCRQDGEAINGGESPHGRVGITTTGLVQNQWRNVLIKTRAMVVPPLTGDLLVSGSH